MNQTNTMKNIPDAERPYEKCMAKGPAALSDAELLSVLLRNGTRGENVLALAGRILYGDGRDGLCSLYHMDVCKLKKIRGIGRVKALQILCLTELAGRMARTSDKKGPSFSTPRMIAQYYMEELRHEGQEVIRLLMFDSKNHLLADPMIAKGTVNMAVISPREIFVEAMKREAVSIVLLHNHPSGDPTPSEADIRLTGQVRETADLVGIALLDHIVIGDRRYVSFTEENLLAAGKETARPV